MRIDRIVPPACKETNKSFILVIAQKRLCFRIATLPVFLAPAGVLGFHYVEGEHMARELRAVQFTLMDNFPVDENESTCWKDIPVLLFSNCEC